MWWDNVIWPIISIRVLYWCDLIPFIHLAPKKQFKFKNRVEFSRQNEKASKGIYRKIWSSIFLWIFPDKKICDFQLEFFPTKKCVKECGKKLKSQPAKKCVFKQGIWLKNWSPDQIQNFSFSVSHFFQVGFLLKPILCV